MKIKLILFLSILFVFNYSCKKEEIPLTNLNLKVEKIDGVYRCTWNSTNISSFEKYTLIASKDSITEDLDLNFFSPSPKFIEDQTIGTWNFTISTPFEKKYFQLRVDIGDRILYSEIIVFENPHTRIVDNFKGQFLFHYPEIKTMYFGNDGTNKLKAYNYEDDKIKEIEFTQYISGGTGGNNGFGDEIYLFTYDNRLTILDAHTLAFKDWILDFGPEIYSVSTNQNGLITLAVNSYLEPTQIYDRNGLTLLTTHDYANLSGIRSIGFLSKENNKLLEIGKNDAHIYDLNENGGVINHLSAINPFDHPFTQGYGNQLAISPNGNYFASSSRGDMFDSNLTPLGQLKDLTGSNYFCYLFNEENSVMYTSPSVLNTTNNASLIQKFSLPDLSIVETFENERYTPIYLFYIEDQIMILAISHTDYDDKVIINLKDF